MKSGAAVDRAYAKRTKKAISQQKVWHINRVLRDQDCAERLDTITNELDGYVWQVEFQKPYWVILWWTWIDPKSGRGNRG